MESQRYCIQLTKQEIKMKYIIKIKEVTKKGTKNSDIMTWGGGVFALVLISHAMTCRMDYRGTRVKRVRPVIRTLPHSGKK